MGVVTDCLKVNLFFFNVRPFPNDCLLLSATSSIVCEIGPVGATSRHWGQVEVEVKGRKKGTSSMFFTYRVNPPSLRRAHTLSATDSPSFFHSRTACRSAKQSNHKQEDTDLESKHVAHLLSICLSAARKPPYQNTPTQTPSTLIICAIFTNATQSLVDKSSLGTPPPNSDNAPSDKAFAARKRCS